MSNSNDEVTRAPADEPSGYSSIAGYVKSRPENNDHYIAQFESSDWYPVLASTHRTLNELIPGYNISQIKNKFGGLRYYFTYPDVIPIKPEWPAYNSVEKIKVMVDNAISYAEGWVAGLEATKRNAGK